MDMGDINCSLTESELNTFNIQSKKWTKLIPFPIVRNNHPLLFDVASCQFAMHYMFQSREKAKHFFRQVYDQLAHDGVLVTTTVDSRVISSLVLQEVTNSPNNTTKQRSLKFYADTPSPGLSDDMNQGKF